MRRLSIAGIALAAACLDSNQPTSQAVVRISPLLDSLFVGDTTPPLLVAYYDDLGNPQPVGAITWGSEVPGVATVDPSGRVAGVGRGQTVIRATTRGATGRALVVVTRDLEVTLTLDTIYLMPGDTFRVPVGVRRKGGSAPAPRFEAPVQAVLDMDSTGFVTANTYGGPIQFVARADTVADTGAVHVLLLTDTTDGGRGYFSLFGTVTQDRSAPARGLNYRLRGGDRRPAFRLSLSALSGGSEVERVWITLMDSVAAPDEYLIDSLSPEEALGQGSDFICSPTRPWAIWGALYNPPINAVSLYGGSIAVTQVDTVPAGFVVISGRFRFEAQRIDFYDDPGGLLPIRGTFVAPLVTDLTSCP